MLEGSPRKLNQINKRPRRLRLRRKLHRQLHKHHPLNNPRRHPCLRKRSRPQLKPRPRQPNLLRRCNKPDRKEFMRVMTATGIGFLVMGGLGFLAKLIHIRESAGDLGAARLLGRRRARSPGPPDAQSSLRAIAVSTCLPSSPRTHAAVNKILVGA